MCTLTYLPKKEGGYYLTSNRDENINRKSALAPTIYSFNQIQLLFPKDAIAGGTWLAASDTGYTICLLNGAFVKHFPEPPYRKSRGLVLLDFFEFNNVDLFTELYNFNGIEPFTLVVFPNQKQIHELRWDGNRLHHKLVDQHQAQIWSSATLYDIDIVQKREQVFQKFIHAKSTIGVDDLLNFHHFSGNENAQESIKLSRNNNGVQTISVSCIESNAKEFIMHHEDLLAQTVVDSHLLKNISPVQG